MGRNGWAARLIGAVLALTGATASAGTYYFHTDHLGTPQVLTDASGSVVWEGRYEPFGEVTETVAQVEQNLRFPGQYLDRETGLHQNWFRDYDPGTGRYIQSDPIGLGGGVNTYGYAYANPTIYTDPTGEFVPVAVWAALSVAYAIAEAGLSAYDAYVTARTLTDACVGFEDKLIAGGGLLAGVLLPGNVNMIAKGANSLPSKPLLGDNPVVKKDRTLTDLHPVHNRATAKSIFRNQTRGQRIRQFENRRGDIIRRSDDGTQIRMSPDGKTRLDLPRRGTQPNGETVHFNPK